MSESVENLPGGAASGSTGIESGDASASLLRAVEAASSAATQPEGQTGDTVQQAGDGTPGATAGATAQPAQTASPAGSQPATDQTPEHRIQAAVRNAREATRREVMAEFSAFQGMNPEEARLGLELLTELRADPAKFFKELAARVQGAGGATEEEPFPEADLVSKDGQLKTYRDATIQKMLDIHGRRVTAQIMGQLNPYLQHIQQDREARQVEADRAARHETIASALHEARQLPHFTRENEPAILAALQAIPQERRQALGPVAALHVAYSQFLRDKVLPGVESKAAEKVRDDFMRKANAGGSIHPGSGGGTPTAPKLKTEEDLARHMERMASAS